MRSGRQHFLYSRLMCWVAIDRALRLAEKRSFPADRERWIKVRDEIYEEIQAKGWSTDRNAFVQYYGSDSLDAALLMMPLVFFMSPTDPRDRAHDRCNYASAGGARAGFGRPGLSIQRGGGAGRPARQGRHVQHLHVLAGGRADAHGACDRRRLDDARLMFERMLGYANHLGLVRRADRAARGGAR